MTSVATIGIDFLVDIRRNRHWFHFHRGIFQSLDVLDYYTPVVVPQEMLLLELQEVEVEVEVLLELQEVEVLQKWEMVSWSSLQPFLMEMVYPR